MTNTTELKKLAEAASLTGAQLVGMSASEFAEAQRLKQQFRQIRPEAILKLLAINAELVEALKRLERANDVRAGLVSGEAYRLSILIHGMSDALTELDFARSDARAALAKAEGGEL